MTVLQKFLECNDKREYKTARGKLDWKKADNRLYFAPTDGTLDWIKNFLFLPLPAIINGVIYFIPFGAWLDLREIRKICRENDSVVEAVGYSRGGWAACLAGLILRVKVVTFGCPGVIWCPSKTAQSNLDKYVVHYENPHDIVCAVPPTYQHSKERRVLGGEFKYTTEEAIPCITGHTPQEYAYRLSLLSY